MPRRVHRPHLTPDADRQAADAAMLEAVLILVALGDRYLAAHPELTLDDFAGDAGAARVDAAHARRHPPREDGT